MRVKENEKVGLKLNIQKMIMASGPITSWQTEGEKMEAVTDFLFLGSKITEDGDCSHEIRRPLLLGRKAIIPPIKTLQLFCSLSKFLSMASGSHMILLALQQAKPQPVSGTLHIIYFPQVFSKQAGSFSLDITIPTPSRNRQVSQTIHLKGTHPPPGSSHYQSPVLFLSWFLS